MIRKLIRYSSLFALGMLIISHPVRVYAGSVNGNEAAVISTAKGSFEYKGKIYQAQAGYLRKLEEYLSQDDVDMTQEQAQEAIANIQANVAQGIAEGYLVEADVKEDDSEKEPVEITKEAVSDSLKGEESTEQPKTVEQKKNGTLEVKNKDGELVLRLQGTLKNTGYSSRGIWGLVAAGSGILLTGIWCMKKAAGTDEV